MMEPIIWLNQAINASIQQYKNELFLFKVQLENKTKISSRNSYISVLLLLVLLSSFNLSCNNSADCENTKRNTGITFEMTGEHVKIGSHVDEMTGVENKKWRAILNMSGDDLHAGSHFWINASLKILDDKITEYIYDASEIYMVAVLEPVYDVDGNPRQFTNLQVSGVMTPSGLPIENLQYNLPSEYKGNHYRTPWELLNKVTPSEINLNNNSMDFFVDTIIPEQVNDGYYRLAIEFGVKINGQFVKLELLPYMGAILSEEDESISNYYSINEVIKTMILRKHSPVFKIGSPAQPRMPWTIMGKVYSHGTRGVVAREDKDNYAINYTGVRQEKMIIPMKDRAGRYIRYSLEPDFPTQMKQQELFEPSTDGNFEGRVPSHVMLDPVQLDYSSGEVEVSVKAPSGKISNLGSHTFKGETATGATTGGEELCFEFSEYGHHEITLKGYIYDVSGHKYVGGGTYDVWVAKSLSFSTSCKPGTPYIVGSVYSPRVSVHPGVPADIQHEVRLYRNSRKDDVQVWKHSGKANRYGYFFPREKIDFMRFDAPGEYISRVDATYWDDRGQLWMGSQISASVVAEENENITAHGDRMGFQTMPFDMDQEKYFNERYELKAGGEAGTLEIPNLPTNQIRNSVPYNVEDVLFFSPGLNWNYSMVFPTLSFSSKKKGLEKDVLDVFPELEKYLPDKHGETLQDRLNCWGKQMVDSNCLSWYDLDLFLHKASDNLSVMSYGKNGYQPFAYPEDTKILSYYYSSSFRPGQIAKRVVTDSSNSTNYWSVTPNFFARQFGAGVNGDSVGDVYKIMGGVVYRNLESGDNEYAIYTGSAVVADPRDENDRIEAPLQSPLVNVGGRDYWIYFGNSPEPGTVYETGDNIVAGGFVIPAMEMDFSYRLDSPDKTILSYSGKSNKYGFFKVPGGGEIAGSPGLYKAFLEFTGNGHTDSVVGKPSGGYHLYVVDPDSPYKIDLDLSAYSNFDPLGALEIHGELPADWESGNIYFTVSSPGQIYSDGEIKAIGKDFSYRYVPLHARVFSNKNEIIDVVNKTYRNWETLIIVFFIDGVSSSGNRITAATEVVVRGNSVLWNDAVEQPHHKGPPSSRDNFPDSGYATFPVAKGGFNDQGTELEKQTEKPLELISRKCMPCHTLTALEGSNGSIGEWSHVVNWHMDKNTAWLRESERRELVDALHATYPSDSNIESAREQKLISEGNALFIEKCTLSCHSEKALLSRRRSRKGWNNIIDRSIFFETKNKGEHLFKDTHEREVLLDYLTMVAGSEAALFEKDPDSAQALYQNNCFNCHATTLRVFDWQRMDRTLLKEHALYKLENKDPETVIMPIIDYIYGK